MYLTSKLDCDPSHTRSVRKVSGEVVATDGLRPIMDGPGVLEV